MPSQNRTIIREKGVQLCVQMLVEHKPTREIVAHLMENGGVARSTIERWLTAARPKADELKKQAEDLRLQQHKAVIIEDVRNTHINREAAEERLWSIFTANLQDFFTPNNNMINVANLPREKAGLLASVEVDELYHGAAGQRYWVGQTKKVKLLDPLKAFEQLAKLKGWYKDDGGTTINNFIIGYGKEVPV